MTNKNKLEYFYNFDGHPGGYPRDDSTKQEGDPRTSYRQGWHDCYWEIYDAFDKIEENK